MNNSPSCGLKRIGLLAILSAVLTPLIGSAEDWPQWRGTGRRGVWTEDGILEQLPESGLAYTWRAPIHEGHAGPAVSGGRVFVMDFIRERGIRGTERALALVEKTGELLWKQEWPVDYSGTEPVWANGPRATPTVNDGRVYFMGGMGQLVCADASSGAIVWQRNLVADFEAAISTWGVASAPIVAGELLIALVGGPADAGVVAFDKTTGEERWRALTFKGDSGYVPPILIRAGGVEQLIIWHPEAVVGLDPASGDLYWQQPFTAGMDLIVATPVVDRDRLLVSAFFDGSMLLRLEADRPASSVLWRRHGKSEQPGDTDSLHALISTPILDGEYLYGVGSYGEMRGLRASDGERLWESIELVGEQARWAAALIVRHGDRYFINTDRGDLVIAEFSPAGYREVDRTHLIEPTTKGGGRRELGRVHWSHPAYANRHIVVRNDREIVRADLSASANQ